MASIAVDEANITASSIPVYVTDLDTDYVQGQRFVWWYIDGEEKGTEIELDIGVAEGANYTFTGLDPLTTYTIDCKIGYDVDGNENWEFVDLDPVEATTIDGTAGYELIEGDLTSEGSIDFSNQSVYEFTGYIRTMELYRWKCSFAEDCTIAFYSNVGNDEMDMIGYYTTTLDWDEVEGEPDYLNDEYGDITEDDGGQEFSNSASKYDFGASFDVEAGKTYYLWWKLYDGSPDGSYSVYLEKYDGGSSDIALWSWEVSNGTATDAETKLAHDAITGHGPTTDFSHKVWNDLVTKIKTVQGYWMTETTSSGAGGLTFEKTCMDTDDATDRILTADRFNSMKYNLGRNYSTGIADVAPDDQVLGSYFITIADKLNEWIESL